MKWDQCQLLYQVIMPSKKLDSLRHCIAKNFIRDREKEKAEKYLSRQTSLNKKNLVLTYNMPRLVCVNFVAFEQVNNY